ncbi:MAG: Smr/MutS family protein [Myxococcaceae bacterium]|nr:Smr/MutS family protein [Myxococcaceae bacterium]
MSKQEKSSGPPPFNNPFAKLKASLPKPAAKENERRAQAPPPSAPRPSKRALSIEELERQQFLEAVGEVEPVRHVPVPAPRPADIAARHGEESESLAQLAELVTGGAALERIDDGEHLLSHVKGLDPRVVRKLKQGEFAIDRELDLHGMKRAEAQSALQAFVTQSRRAQSRCLRVITGRGLHSAEGEAVLKDAVPTWLESASLAKHVLAFSVAAPKHGGPGALYVLLRK